MLEDFPVVWRMNENSREQGGKFIEFFKVEICESDKVQSSPTQNCAGLLCVWGIL